MNTFLLSVLFFIVGTLEWYIDSYEKLVSVRLKLLSTLFYSTLNQVIDFFMYVFLFSILIQFWETWHNGVHDYYKLIPYVLYTLGKIFGTVLATWLYAKNKNRKDHEHTLKLISKTDKKGKKRSKKKYNKMVNDAVTKMSTETLLDPIETADLKDQIKGRVIETAAQKISEKIDQALDQENNS